MKSAEIFENRRQVLAWVHLISGLTLMFFVVIHWFDGCCMALMYVEMTLAVVMLGTYWRVRLGASTASAENTLMASALLLFSGLIFLTSIEDTGIYWLAGLPFVVYFVQQVNTARYWVAFFVMELLIALLLQWFELVHTSYTETQLFHIVTVVLFYWIFAHIYQSQLEWRKRQLTESYRALAEQQDRMQVILDHSPIGIWMVDQHRKVQFVNRAWVKICGISEAEAQQADDYTRLLPESMIEMVLASDEACLASPHAFYGRDEIVCADGVVRVFDFIKVRLAKDDQVSGLVAFAIDVTEKLTAEVEQKSLEQQVQHAQRLESLGLMAGGIAHDFNNLLTVIQGNVELAKLDHDISESMRESLGCVESATHVATDLCRQMLDYSGKSVMQAEAMDLQNLVKEMLPLLEASKAKKVNLSFSEQQAEAWVMADGGQIRQVLLNLVINASEAIGNEQTGDIHISITQQQLAAGDARHFSNGDLSAGDYIVLNVKDDGMGMDTNTIERIFDPFFTTKFTGRGLGMSATLGILRSHDAAMQINSQLGKGTTMSVWIPAIDQASHAHLIQPRDIKRSVSGRVLLVDDEPGVIHVASRMLEHLGLSVATANNGREAVELFGSDSDFDWVLLDVTMPEMGGMECLNCLREIRPDIYVAMSSGYDAETALDLDRQCQPNDFISKPFSLDMLRSVVAKATK
ncbi:MAG: response regulator [Mariprofundus sp.]|nr:response regulator [Mariprofundus sp.]